MKIPEDERLRVEGGECMKSDNVHEKEIRK
jgi:hypothetical protein